MPLIVLSAGSFDATPLLSDAENQQLWKEMQAQQSELADLSSDSKQIIAEESGHFIQLDQPELLIDVIREIFNEVQK
jgi:pimeloyl-ACP methyl ester carboxylesterase